MISFFITGKIDCNKYKWKNTKFTIELNYFLIYSFIWCSGHFKTCYITLWITYILLGTFQDIKGLWPTFLKWSKILSFCFSMKLKFDWSVEHSAPQIEHRNMSKNITLGALEHLKNESLHPLYYSKTWCYSNSDFTVST